MSSTNQDRESGPSNSRRSLLRTVGAGAALGALAPLPALAQYSRAITDQDILNFALNLEYLEAEYYTYAVTGQGIDALGIGITGKGNAGRTLGGRKVEFQDPMLRRIAEELAYDEQQHVKLLREVLGDNAIAKPTIDLNGLKLGFDSDAEYLTLSRALEDTGTSAYAGAAPLLKDKVIIGISALILADEAYHMGNIRYLIAHKNVSVPKLDPRDVPPPPSGDRLFALDSNGLGLTRTFDEVIAIAKPFFPLGINGNIQAGLFKNGALVR